MSEPWLKFYTSDWRADPRLKMCSPAARGMWIEMICLMHEATPYGHLMIHGQSPNEAQLASLTGILSAEVPDLIGELERLGVFSRTREGVIYSRKLVRMASRAAVSRKNGKKGGNPTLGNQTENTSRVNLQDKGRDKTQIPDTRIQKESPHTPQGVSFADFWASWPNKTAKAQAEKAWKKLNPTDREAAASAAVAWFADWRRKHPDASPIHPASYLNQRRWEDEGPKQPVQVSRFDAAASNIRSGKPYLCGNISATLARELISQGLVTEAQCREVRVI